MRKSYKDKVLLQIEDRHVALLVHAVWSKMWVTEQPQSAGTCRLYGLSAACFHAQHQQTLKQ